MGTNSTEPKSVSLPQLRDLVDFLPMLVQDMQDNPADYATPCDGCDQLGFYVTALGPRVCRTCKGAGIVPPNTN